jgi:hypothetical protein
VTRKLSVSLCVSWNDAQRNEINERKAVAHLFNVIKVLGK